MENLESCLPGRQTGENTEKYRNKPLKNSSNPVIIKHDTKLFNILSVLAAGDSLNRFQAINHNDTTLNSTISSLGEKGIIISRKWEKVPCVNGTKKADVCRYWLEPDQIEVAKKLLGLKNTVMMS